MTMTYLMLALYFVTLGVLSYLLGFVAKMGVPGMVLAFVIVSFIINIIFFWLINYRTDWQDVINISNKKSNEEKTKTVETVRRLSNVSMEIDLQIAENAENIAKKLGNKDDDKNRLFNTQTE